MRSLLRFVWAAALVLPLKLEGAAAQTAAIYAGVLVRRDSTPVPSARIRLMPVDRRQTTDERGRFEFRDVLPGRYTVMVTAPNGPPVSHEVVLLPGEHHQTRIVLADEPQRLAEITVAADSAPLTATDRRLDAFNRRRKRGHGVFLTAADIARRNPRLLSDALVAVQTIRIMERGSGKVAIAARSLVPVRTAGGIAAAPCILRLVIDGQAFPAGTSLDMVPPHEVAGMEIYGGAATMPVEFAHYQEDTWCGVIAIWTRGG